jgi:hypothetical protein
MWVHRLEAVSLQVGVMFGEVLCLTRDNYREIFPTAKSDSGLGHVSTPSFVFVPWHVHLILPSAACGYVAANITNTKQNGVSVTLSRSLGRKISIYY